MVSVSTSVTSFGSPVVKVLPQERSARRHAARFRPRTQPPGDSEGRDDRTGRDRVTVGEALDRNNVDAASVVTGGTLDQA
jgi:hypothetical protein